jgi:5-methylthioribose kinase
VIQNLALNYLSHYAHTPDKKQRKEYQAYLLELMRNIWLGFAEKFENLWINNNNGELVPTKYWDFDGGDEAFAEYRRQYIQKLFNEMVGIAGTKLLRRMMGIVTVWDISSIEDPEKRSVSERLAIKLGTRWIMEADSIHTIDEMLDVLKLTTRYLD